MVAAEKSKPEIVKLLVDKDAEATILVAMDCTPLCRNVWFGGNHENLPAIGSRYRSTRSEQKNTTSLRRNSWSFAGSAGFSHRRSKNQCEKRGP